MAVGQHNYGAHGGFKLSWVFVKCPAHPGATAGAGQGEGGKGWEG